MDDSQPGLFDLPDDEAPTAPSSGPDRSQRGRNRETWSCTATADVTIVDEAAIREAVELAEERGLIVGVRDDPVGDDTVDEVPEEQAGDDVLDALAWLIWPTDGLDDLLEAGAFRIDSVESKIVAESDDGGTLSWSATVKLTDVEALRRVAVQAHPAEAESISRSLPTAWQYAADPFAPLRSIPGISWRPGQLTIRHVPRRSREA